MLLIIPYFIIVAGISFIPAIIAVAGGILAIVTEKIKKNPAYTPEVKAFKKKKAIRTTVIVASIIAFVVILLTVIAVVGILDVFRLM